MMEYKGYLGSVNFDEDGQVFHGEVANIRDVVTYEGSTGAEFLKAFHESVDDYLEFCKARGEAPEKPFSGQFVTRIPPDLHRQVHHASLLSGKSLNAWVAEQLQAAVVTTKSAKSTSAIKAGRQVKRAPRSSGKNAKPTVTSKR